MFNTIHDTKEIVDMASSVGNYYDRLHMINCRKELLEDFPEREHIRAIWLALNASYALEAFRFMVSFATSLAMVENKIFIGNGNIIQLILQDEILHKEWTGWIINQVVKEDPRLPIFLKTLWTLPHSTHSKKLASSTIKITHAPLPFLGLPSTWIPARNKLPCRKMKALTMLLVSWATVLTTTSYQNYD